MSKLTIITMLSDWHVGSGTGRPGSIDRLVQRDPHNLPYIPAKTLTGILRDGCELVVAGLDEGSGGRWHEWLEYLFGSQPPLEPQGTEKTPVTAALSMRSAHFPASLQQALQQKRELQAALTFVKPGVAIDPKSGTAEPECLRFEEMVRSGSYLEAKYELNVTGLEDLQIHTLEAILVAGAALVERLGGKRRRGAGKCQIKLPGIDLTTALKYLEGEPPVLPASLELTPSKSLETEKLGKWYEIELHLETQSHLIIHARTLGNLVSTLDYIPGTALLPIVAKQLRSIVDASNAIANNRLIISNATPEVEQQQGRAMPFALFQEKLNDKLIYNRIGESFQVDRDPEDRPQLKGMRSGYVGQKIYATGSTGVATHNTVEDAIQRPAEDVGGVYSYETIPPQTKFRARLYLQETVISQDNAQECLGELAGKNIEIGRSKKDDYGLVKIDRVNFLPTSDRQIAAVPVGGELRVWLLSDVLIRNSRLRPSTNPEDFARALSEKLGVEIALKPNSLSVLARTRRIDSWQTRWGLPRPSLVGLSAGSCFLFVTTGEISSEKLAEVEFTGIGERTAEGYGRLCCNDRLLMDKQPDLSKHESIDNTNTIVSIDLQSSPELNEYMRTIEKEAWREAIRRTALYLAANPVQRWEILGIEINDRHESRPSMSQLGVLRSIVMTVIRSDFSHNLIVNDWLDRLGDQWTKNSLDKIRSLLTELDRVWLLLESIDFDRLILSNEGKTALKQDLWLETVQILVISCLRAHKRDVEDNSLSPNP